MESIGSLLIAVGPSELPALLLLTVVIVAYRKAACGWRLALIYGLAILQLALPVLMLTSVLLLGPDRGVMVGDRSTSYRMSYLPICLYLLQVPVGGLIAYFMTRSERIKNPVKITVALVSIQMAFSFPVAIMTALEITGAFI